MTPQTWDVLHPWLAAAPVTQRWLTDTTERIIPGFASLGCHRFPRDWGWAEQSSSPSHLPEAPVFFAPHRYLHTCPETHLAEHELPAENLNLLKYSLGRHAVPATNSYRWLCSINTINMAVLSWSSLLPGFPLKVSLSLARSSAANCFLKRSSL